MSNQAYIEPAIPLAQLRVGDTVLGLQNPDDPSEPRTTHLVTAPLGDYHVPTEDPTAFDRLLIKLGAERLLAGPKVRGILVDGANGDLGLFALDTTPTLDRVIS